MIKRRSKIDKHYATFINAYISIWARIKLWLKKYKVEVFNSDNCPSFKVSW